LKEFFKEIGSKSVPETNEEFWELPGSSEEIYASISSILWEKSKEI